MRQIMTIVFFEFTLLMLLIAFGSASGGTTATLLNNYEQQIFAPWPTAPPLPTVHAGNITTVNCVWYDIDCQTIQFFKSLGNGAANAAVVTLIAPLQFIGAGVVWGVSLGLSFLQRISAFGNLYLILMSEPDLTSIPFIGQFITIVIPMTVLIYAITIIRGNPSGF